MRRRKIAVLAVLLCWPVGAAAVDQAQRTLSNLGVAHAHVHWAGRNCGFTVRDEYTAWVLKRAQGAGPAFVVGVQMGDERAKQRAQQMGKTELCSLVRREMPDAFQ